MIKSNLRFAVIALGAMALANASAATIAWTNTSGGNWSVVGNWNPNQVPGEGDAALITSTGTYAVTLDASATIASLTLGGASGKQTLTTSGNSLSLANASTVNPNGIFTLSGGTFSGTGLLTVQGLFNWTDGLIGNLAAVTIATNAVLNISGGSALKQIQGLLINAGTITWSGANDVQVANDGFNYGGAIINLTGALFDIQNDQTLVVYASGSFNNAGTVRKSAGPGTNTVSVAFNNSGTVDVQTGTLSFDGGGAGNGSFNAAANATLVVAAGYTFNSGAVIAGAGTNRWTGGTVTANGTVTALNLELAGATLGGTNTLTGTIHWTDGLIGNLAAVTIATNAVMNISGGRSLKQIQGALTNAGTITWSGTNDVQVANDGFNYSGAIINLADGLFDIQNDQTLAAYGSGFFNNTGTVRKSAGPGTNILSVPFNNSGAVDVQTGTVSFASGSTFSSGSAFTGAGRSLLGSGSVTLNGAISSANLELAGATLVGTNTLTGTIRWTDGIIGNLAAVTLATNAVMNISGGSLLKQIQGALTNAGTITWSGTNDVQVANDGFNYSGAIINLAGGLLDIQNDQTLVVYGSGFFNNAGTVRKSAGPGTNTLSVPFNNSGTVDVQTGTLSFNGSYDLTGGRLNFGLNSLSDFGTINLSGNAMLTGTLSANLNNGYVPIQGNAFAVLTYGSENGSFTDLNLPSRMAWQSNYEATVFTLTVLNVSPALPVQINQAINELTTLTVTNTAADPDLPADTLTYTLLTAPGTASISANGVITWATTEADGPAAIAFTTRVVDNGTPSLAATNTFTVTVNELNVAPVLTVPTNRTINELTFFADTATAADADLPANPLTFALVSGPTNLTVSPAGAITWTPSEAQGPGSYVVQIKVTDSNPPAVNGTSLSVTSSFTLTVNEVNVAPVITVPADQTIHAGSFLSSTATATDADLPANTLTFERASGPTGLSVSGAGLITWPTADANAGTTNPVTVRVFDNGTPNLSATGTFSVVVVSRPLLLTPAVSGANLNVTWTAIPATSYRLEFNTNLSVSNWNSLAGDVTAVGSTASKLDPLTTNNRTYRVRVLP